MRALLGAARFRFYTEVRRLEPVAEERARPMWNTLASRVLLGYATNLRGAGGPPTTLRAQGFEETEVNRPLDLLRKGHEQERQQLLTTAERDEFKPLGMEPSTKQASAMNERERITINPNQCGGRPCIRGMRIRVKDVLDLLAGGATQEGILTDFPDLQAEDIRACIAYAARYLDHTVLVTA